MIDTVATTNSASTSASSSVVAPTSPIPTPTTPATTTTTSPTPTTTTTTTVPPGHGGLIQNLTPKDVLSGRGGRVNAHEGNVYFRRIVEEYKHEYLARTATKTRKARIAAEIVARVRRADGRFLKIDSASGSWVEIGDEKARRKAGQALREDASNVRRAMDGDGDVEDGDANDNDNGSDGTPTDHKEETTPPPPASGSKDKKRRSGKQQQQSQSPTSVNVNNNNNSNAVRTSKHNGHNNGRKSISPKNRRDVSPRRRSSSDKDPFRDLSPPRVPPRFAEQKSCDNLPPACVNVNLDATYQRNLNGSSSSGGGDSTTTHDVVVVPGTRTVSSVTRQLRAITETAPTTSTNTANDAVAVDPLYCLDDTPLTATTTTTPTTTTTKTPTQNELLRRLMEGQKYRNDRTNQNNGNNGDEDMNSEADTNNDISEDSSDKNTRRMQLVPSDDNNNRRAHATPFSLSSRPTEPTTITPTITATIDPTTYRRSALGSLPPLHHQRTTVTASSIMNSSSTSSTSTSSNSGSSGTFSHDDAVRRMVSPSPFSTTNSAVTATNNINANSTVATPAELAGNSTNKAFQYFLQRSRATDANYKQSHHHPHHPHYRSNNNNDRRGSDVGVGDSMSMSMSMSMSRSPTARADVPANPDMFSVDEEAKLSAWHQRETLKLREQDARLAREARLTATASFLTSTQRLLDRDRDGFGNVTASSSSNNTFRPSFAFRPMGVLEERYQYDNGRQQQQEQQPTTPMWTHNSYHLGPLEPMNEEEEEEHHHHQQQQQPVPDIRSEWNQRMKQHIHDRDSDRDDLEREIMKRETTATPPVVTPVVDNNNNSDATNVSTTSTSKMWKRIHRRFNVIPSMGKKVAVATGNADDDDDNGGGGTSSSSTFGRRRSSTTASADNGNGNNNGATTYYSNSFSTHGGASSGMSMSSWKTSLGDGSVMSVSIAGKSNCSDDNVSWLKSFRTMRSVSSGGTNEFSFDSDISSDMMSLDLGSTTGHDRRRHYHRGRNNSNGNRSREQQQQQRHVNGGSVATHKMIQHTSPTSRMFAEDIDTSTNNRLISIEKQDRWHI